MPKSYFIILKTYKTIQNTHKKKNQKTNQKKQKKTKPQTHPALGAMLFFFLTILYYNDG